MEDNRVLNYIKDVLRNMPAQWLNLTTHRLDIYVEKLAKVQFLEELENLFDQNESSKSKLNDLPTAFDYIRLGHPLSCVLEWAIAKQNNLKPECVIGFSSQTIPAMAILRKNLVDNKKTQILYKGDLPKMFDAEVLRRVYGYQFELRKVENATNVSAFDGSTVYFTRQNELGKIEHGQNIDFVVSVHPRFGSVMSSHGEQNESYNSEIQHVRRRETIAMTPADCLSALHELIGESEENEQSSSVDFNKNKVIAAIKEISGADTTAVVGSSGLSIQYAILMGLVDHAFANHPGKDIKIIVPPNCYGGTNDQARRVAACIDNVEVVDMPVDGGQNMVQSIDVVLDRIAKADAVPYIIAEIPTNPRVEVPNLVKLEAALSEVRKTASGEIAIDPVFILDQTFCPNVHFLGEDDILSTVRTLAYVSGSKFPSGGKCNAGFCVANKKAENLMAKIDLHQKICDNEATDLQYEILAQQLPSMNQRISDAYVNTRDFVNFITQTLPEAKINFVSEELAKQGFTPSVFSLDLPTKGNSEEEREAYKRELNHKLISLMISQIPDESKHCVSYGQLKGCYWTIPATSTQGTTKEGDKDYIARVALSPRMNLELHKKVFVEFVKGI